MLNARIVELEKMNDNKDKDIRRLESLNIKNNTTTNKLNILLQQHSDEITKLKEDIDDKLNEINEHKQCIANDEDMLHVLQVEKEELNKNCKNLNKRVNELEEELKNANKEIEILKASQLNLIVEEKIIETDTKEIQTDETEDINSLHEKINELNDEINRLKSIKPKVTIEQKEDYELIEKCSKLLKENEQLLNDIDNFKKENNDLKMKIEERNIKIAEENEKNKNKIDTLNNEILKYKDNENELNETNKKQNELINELNEKIITQNEEIKKLNEELDSEKHDNITTSLFESIRLSVVNPQVKVVIGNKKYNSTSKLTDEYIQKELNETIVPKFGKMYLSVGGKEDEEMKEWLNSLGDKLQESVKQLLQDN